VKLLVGVSLRVARVAPQLAHVRAEGGSWNVTPTPAQKQKSPPRRLVGRADREEADVIWY
jgi:hypothetical protein